eukprot:678769-Prorocentrum_minimum.AAC.2
MPVSRGSPVVRGGRRPSHLRLQARDLLQQRQVALRQLAAQVASGRDSRLRRHEILRSAAGRRVPHLREGARKHIRAN